MLRLTDPEIVVVTSRWAEAGIPVRISRDDRFATLYPAQALASLITAPVNLVVDSKQHKTRDDSKQRFDWQSLRRNTDRVFACLLYTSDAADD